jgi:serine/threonine protein kinase
LFLLLHCTGIIFFLISDYTNRVDIWGVGVTAFEFLSGNPPFFNLEPLAAMFKIAQKKMKNELSFPAPVPDIMRDFVLLCLEQDPNDRPNADVLLEHSLFSKCL